MPKKSVLPFSLSKRNDKKKNFYYVYFRNPITNKLSIKRSTGETEEDKAIIKAWQIYNSEIENINAEIEKKTDIENVLNTMNENQLKFFLEQLKIRGFLSSYTIAESKQDIKASDFLIDFWTWEKSEYIKDLLASKKSIHKHYCNDNLKYIQKYWTLILSDKMLNEITLDDIRNVKKSLYDLDLATSTKNHILKAGIIAIKNAIANELCQMRLIDNQIPKDIYFSNNYKKREILTFELAMLLFAKEWKNPISKLANKLSMITGMRKGEIMALRKMDLGENCIYVRHSWSNLEGLKSTKTNEERTVVIPFDDIMQELKELASKNPHTNDLTGFIFWSTLPNKPLDEKVFITNLKDELSELIGKKEAKKYCFHAWRHFFVKNMKNKVANSVLQQQTGHKTLEMLEHYANHTDNSDMIELSNEISNVFNPILAETKTISFDESKIYNDLKKHGKESKYNDIYLEAEFIENK